MPPRRRDTQRAVPFERSDEPLLWLACAGREVRTDASYFFDAAARSDVPHVTLQSTLAALRNGPEKIDVIARRCGSSGANDLCRAFQRRWRITPGRYRTTPSLTVLP